jgi:chromosome segregation ATPase
MEKEEEIQKLKTQLENQSQDNGNASQQLKSKEEEITSLSKKFHELQKEY